MPFKQLTDKINYHALESEILKYWDERHIFDKSVTSRRDGPAFTFYEGPPTANGRPGIHHVMSRTLKDLVCRYKTMRGFQVHRKAGWDTHGLPVEIEVEKALGFKHKDQIVDYGIARFNEECKKSVWKYKEDWEEMTRMMGYWVDLAHPYVTFENNYIESVWWALKQYFEKGMIYKGYKIQPYCPRCETPLSSHEVSLGYKDVKDPSVYVKMKVKGEENTYFLVWTTTPWTLISNVVLAVNPNVDYVKVEHKSEKLILAKARLDVLEGEYTILEDLKGEEIVGLQYEPLFHTKLNQDLLSQEDLGYTEIAYNRQVGDVNVDTLYLETRIDTRAMLFESPLVIAHHYGRPVVMSARLFARLRGYNLKHVKTLSKDEFRKVFKESQGLPRGKSLAFMGPKAFFVLPADFVTTEDGSGIVHIAPAYGEDDYQLGQRYEIPTLHPVNKSGEFDVSVERYSGKFVKDADPEIIADLKHRGILYKKETHLHSYPHCWRCTSPLLYYARESWYIRTTDYAQRMIDLNNTIRWIPAEVGSGRFGNWLEENKDWALSRDRFWVSVADLALRRMRKAKVCGEYGGIEGGKQCSGSARPPQTIC